MDEHLLHLLPHDMIRASEEQIETIRTAAGFSTKQFDTAFLPILVKYAEQAQNLPLSPHYYHKPGGAWKFGLFTAMVSVRVAESKVFFPGEPSNVRRSLEKQCLFAAFAATLATGIAMLTQNVRVFDADFEEYYPLTAEISFHQWLLETTGTKFEWRDEAILTLSECAAIAARFLPPNIVRPFDRRIIRLIYSAIYPQVAPNMLRSNLCDVISKSVDASTKHYRDKYALEYAPGQSKAPASTGAQANELALSIVDETKLPEPDSSTFDTSVQDAAPTSKAPSPDAPKSVPAPSTAPVPPGVTDSAPVQNVSATPAYGALPSADPETGEIVMTADDYIKAASPELIEWFALLKANEAYPAFKKQIIDGETGIELPLAPIGRLGMKATTVIDLFKTANMFVSLTRDTKRVILNSAVKPLFFE